MKITKKFSNRIADHVKLHWVKSFGTVAVVLDDWLFPLLDLMELPYRAGHNTEEARHYVGIQLCNYLKNRISKESVLNDYWMNQYLVPGAINKVLEIVEKNCSEVI